MITKLYSFYETPFTHDVCHLFEHIVLRSFLFKLEENNYNRAFFGWLRGQTTDSTLFFDIGAYSDEVALLFNDHLKTLGNFNANLISQSIAHIEAEMECEIEITDTPLLISQFEQLANIVKNQGTKKISSKNPLKVRYAPSLFYEFAVLINVFTNSEKTKKGFLALHPAILDIVRDAAIDNEAVYPAGKSALAINDGGIGIAWRFKAKKNVNIKTLEDATIDYLQNFNIVDHIKDIDKYQTYFGNEPSNNAAPINFYEQTGIQSTRKELSELITKELLQEIMDSMTVRFSLVTGKLKNIPWDY